MKNKNSLSFTERVYALVRTIPKGSVMTYGEVAARIGSPRAARAVGSALRKNYNPNIPCHRVIKADGTPGYYNRGEERKVYFLKKEGAGSKIKLSRPIKK